MPKRGSSGTLPAGSHADLDDDVAAAVDVVGDAVLRVLADRQRRISRDADELRRDLLGL